MQIWRSKNRKILPFPRQWKVVRDKKTACVPCSFFVSFFSPYRRGPNTEASAWLHILLPFLPAIHYQLTQDRRWFVIANSSFILLLKEKVKSEIVSDPLIVKTIGSPNYTKDDPVLSGEDVKENYIFTWNQNPNLTDGQITYITLQAHIKSAGNIWVTPSLEIWIYSHVNHLKLDPQEFPGIEANRNDYLAQLLDQKFNGRTSLGSKEDGSKRNLIGELTLTSNTENAYNQDFICRSLIFETKDVNSSINNGR
ncbi:MAG: hypothetical protein UDG86_01775 [Lachnospiraceae bacterium]|jgi:hypothetical protein|nr:hypothetical protein [Lachnospiraceae bacterium]